MSGAGGDNASWLVCTDDVGPNSAMPPVNVTADCTDQSDEQFYFFGFGGTSTASPAFAGILALVQNACSLPSSTTCSAGRLGQAAKQLYDLYNGAWRRAASSMTLPSETTPCIVRQRHLSGLRPERAR